ncbi:hypothetical protein BLNAU_14489 [Blattamonas nauphoetae]|uniref:Uncharacterized protein n=1 Tax=Blattamonas nauphoetae TaxID=2049346 RepID=A0ABQ9XGX8_9EUKA|nr:hypothetical protein BLNAU_14489 [Blattamonas nauphoetae]
MTALSLTVPPTASLFEWSGIPASVRSEFLMSEWKRMVRNPRFHIWLSGTQPSTQNPVEVLQASVRLMSTHNTSIPQLSKYIRTFLMFATETGTLLLQTQIEDLHRILTICKRVVSPKRLDDFLSTLDPPSVLQLDRFIDLIGLTVSMPDFEANRVRVLKEPELELTSKYPVSMEDLLRHLDQEYLQTVFSHTSQQLDSSMRKLENKRNAVESLVTDTLSGTRRRSSASPSPSRFTSPSPLRNKSNADRKLRIETDHLNTTKHTHSRSSSPISSRTIRRRGNAVFYSSPTKTPPFSSDSPTHEYLRNATLLKQQRQDEIDAMLSTMSSRTNLSIIAPQSPTKTPHPQSLVTPKDSSPMRSPTRLSVSPRLFPAQDPPKFPYTPKFPAPPFVFSDPNVTYGLNRTEDEIMEEQKHTVIPNPELIKKRKFPHKMPEVPWQFVVDKDGHLFDQAHKGATDPSSELPQATNWETQYETDHKPLRPFSPPKPNRSSVFNQLHHTEIMESAFVLSEELEAELARKRKEAKEEREKKLDETRAERERRKEELEEWLNRMVRKDAFRKEYMVIGGGNQSNSNDTALPTRISPTRKAKDKIDRGEKKFDKRKAQTSEQMDDMFTQQLIAIAEEGHAITKLIHSGKEDVDEDEQENASQASDSNNPLHKYSLEETKLTHENMTGFERKKHKMETRLGKAQNAIQSSLVEFARQREEKQKRGAKIESREKRRKVEMKKMRARERAGIREALEDGRKNPYQLGVEETRTMLKQDTAGDRSRKGQNQISDKILKSQLQMLMSNPDFGRKEKMWLSEEEQRRLTVLEKAKIILQEERVAREQNMSHAVQSEHTRQARINQRARTATQDLRRQKEETKMRLLTPDRRRREERRREIEAQKQQDESKEESSTILRNTTSPSLPPSLHNSHDLSSDDLVSSSPLAQTHSSTSSAKLFPPTSPLTPTRGLHHAKMAFSEQVVDVHVASEREREDEEERQRKVEEEMEFDERRKKRRFSFVESAMQDDEKEDAKTEAVEKEPDEKGEEMDGRQNPPSAPAHPTIPLLPLNFRSRPSSFASSRVVREQTKREQTKREQEATERAASAERESELPKQESTSSLTLTLSITPPDTLLTQSEKTKRRQQFTPMTPKKGTAFGEEGSGEVKKGLIMNTGRGSAASARPPTPRTPHFEKERRKGASPEGDEKAEGKENKPVDPVQTSRFVDGNVSLRKKEGTLNRLIDLETQRSVTDLRREVEMTERKPVVVESEGERLIRRLEKERQDAQAMLWFSQQLTTDDLPALPSQLQGSSIDRLSHLTQTQITNLAEWTEKQREKEEQDKLRMSWKEQSDSEGRRTHKHRRDCGVSANRAQSRERQSGRRKERDGHDTLHSSDSDVSDSSDDEELFELDEGEDGTDWGRRSFLDSLPQPNTLDEIGEPTHSAGFTLHLRSIKSARVASHGGVETGQLNRSFSSIGETARSREGTSGENTERRTRMAESAFVGRRQGKKEEQQTPLSQKTTLQNERKTTAKTRPLTPQEVYKEHVIDGERYERGFSNRERRFETLKQEFFSKHALSETKTEGEEERKRSPKRIRADEISLEEEINKTQTRAGLTPTNQNRNPSPTHFALTTHDASSPSIHIPTLKMNEAESPKAPPASPPTSSSSPPRNSHLSTLLAGANTSLLSERMGNVVEVQPNPSLSPFALNPQVLALYRPSSSLSTRRGGREDERRMELDEVKEEREDTERSERHFSLPVPSPIPASSPPFQSARSSAPLSSRPSSARTLPTSTPITFSRPQTSQPRSHHPPNTQTIENRSNFGNSFTARPSYGSSFVRTPFSPRNTLQTQFQTQSGSPSLFSAQPTPRMVRSGRHNATAMKIRGAKSKVQSRRSARPESGDAGKGGAKGYVSNILVASGSRAVLHGGS